MFSFSDVCLEIFGSKFPIIFFILTVYSNIYLINYLFPKLLFNISPILIKGCFPSMYVYFHFKVNFINFTEIKFNNPN